MKSIIIALLLLAVSCGHPKDYTVTSPDGTIVVAIYEIALKGGEKLTVPVAPGEGFVLKINRK